MFIIKIMIINLLIILTIMKIDRLLCPSKFIYWKEDIFIAQWIGWIIVSKIKRKLPLAIITEVINTIISIISSTHTLPTHSLNTLFSYFLPVYFHLVNCICSKLNLLLIKVEQEKREAKKKCCHAFCPGLRPCAMSLH